MMKKTEQSIGIWMNYSKAQLTEFTRDNLHTTTISDSFDEEDRKETLKKSEFTMHNKEHQSHSLYFKKIENALLAYKDILLFGPTNAKQELFNLLKSNNKFDVYKIEVHSADQMNEQEQQHYVKDFFTKKLK